MNQNHETCNDKTKTRIDEVGITTDNLTSRAGLTFLVHYLEAIGIYPILERYFGSVRESAKGISVVEAFKQLICFFLDGTGHHLTYFDELAEDEGYAATIETSPGDMASSHQMKRFLNKFSFVRNYLFPRLLQDFFIWRLQVTKPEVILLDLDTMVMDNDEAHKREGVEPTYKKVKGFQPLQLKWGPYFVDAVFRGGSKHSNHGDTVIEMIKHVAGRIRGEYDSKVPIVLTADSGFFDQDNFQFFEESQIGYVVGGKLYSDIEERVESSSKEEWTILDKEDDRSYALFSFEDRRGSWEKSRRAVYTRLVDEGESEGENGDRLKSFPFPFPFPFPFTSSKRRRIYYTNLGRGERIDCSLLGVNRKDWLTTKGVVKLAHGRGKDELAHRSLKDFGTEKLPFEHFEPNTAFYYVMVLSLNLEEAFKRDVVRDEEVVSPDCYPSTFKREFIDVAGKIVSTGRRLILKFTRPVWERLKVEKIWERLNSFRTPNPNSIPSLVFGSTAI